MIVDHAAAAKRADDREKAEVVKRALELLLERLDAVETAQDFTANTIAEEMGHTHLELENRLAAVEAQMEKMREVLASLAGLHLGGSHRDIIRALHKEVDAAEAKPQWLDFFTADLNTNLEDLVERVIALEHKDAPPVQLQTRLIELERRLGNIDYFLRFAHRAAPVGATE